MSESDDWVAALSQEQLRDELEKRGLSWRGDVDKLRARLERFEKCRVQDEAYTATPEPGGSKTTLQVPFSKTSLHTPTKETNESPQFLTPTQQGDFREFLSSRNNPPFGQSGETAAMSVPRHSRVQFNEAAWPTPAGSGASHIYNVMRKWNLQFSGARGGDAEAFLIRIEEGRALIPVTDEDIFRCLPFFLTGTALHWFRAKRSNWRTWGEFVTSWRARFGDPDFSFALRDEIMRRTQGEFEPVADYLTCMQALFDRLSPPWSLTEQLNYAYHNMLPRLQVSVPRDDFYDFESLELKATRVERSCNAGKRYQPPPPPERSLFPELAYRPPNKVRNSERVVAAGVNENPTPGSSGQARSVNPRSAKGKTTPHPVPVRNSNIKCWNCGAMGHLSRQCDKPKRRHCYRCGQADTTVNNCRKCSGNGEGGQ